MRPSMVCCTVGGVPTDAHDGLWHVNQDCDLVQLRSGNGRTVVRILSWK
jgi:hypothetical protein